MMTKPKQEYIEGIGRRKTAVARVRISDASRLSCVVNDKPAEQYFPAAIFPVIFEPIALLKLPEKISISVHVRGGGIHAQAEAIRHGLSRALQIRDAALRPELKKAGFLKRDSRMVERKHFGLKKARKAPQWSKR